MNLYSKLLEREAAGKPVTVGLIGAGKFGTMFLSQARLTRGLHVVGVADLNVERARSQLKTAGWEEGAYAASSLGDAFKTRKTYVGADAEALIAFPDVEVIVEATGDPKSGIRFALVIHRAWQAHRDGECGSRCAGRSVARAPRAGRGRRLLASPGAISRR